MPVPPPRFPPPPAPGRRARIARHVARTVVIGQAVAAALTAVAAVVYIGAAGSPSNQSPLAGLAVAVGIVAIVLAVLAVAAVLAAARALRVVGRGSTATVVMVESAAVVLGAWAGPPVGWFMAATGVAVLIALLDVRNATADGSPGAP